MQENEEQKLRFTAAVMIARKRSLFRQKVEPSPTESVASEASYLLKSEAGSVLARIPLTEVDEEIVETRRKVKQSLLALENKQASLSDKNANPFILSSVFLKIGALWLILTGLSAMTVQAQSETSLIAENIRQGGSQSVGLGIGLLGVSFSSITKRRVDEK